MITSDVVRLLDRCNDELIRHNDRSFLNFAIGFISSAQADGRDVSYSDLDFAFEDYLIRYVKKAVGVQES